jgi:predicted enzyme related to lactoylglutathione lyase
MPVTKTYVMLMVADMARALKFYTEAFDASASFDSPHWSEFRVAGATIALHSGGTGANTQTGLGFEVDDLEAAIQQVSDAGGQVTSPLRPAW